MEFRLLYQGPLRAAGSSGRVSEKHAIRKTIHKQLANLWQVTPQLKIRTIDHTILEPGSRTTNATGQEVHTLPSAGRRESLWQILGTKFDRFGYKFVPLVSNHLKLSCGLDILFLRRDMPGVPLVHAGGDIDNRLKVLFDALRIPGERGELPEAAKDADEDPYFFCLLEDDALITEVSVTTDTLMTPHGRGDENDVHLVIKVRVRPTDFSFENLAFTT